MAIDRINFGVVMMQNGVDFANQDNHLHSVGMSELKDYLRSVYDPAVPHDPAIGAAMERVFETGTALSTDEFLAIPRMENIPYYLPHFLRLAIPMMAATENLGQVLDRHMGILEKEEIPLSKEAVDDMTYGGGTFDLMTIMATAELGIPHPRDSSETARDALQRTMPESHSPVTPDTNPVNLLLKTPFASLEERQVIHRLRKRARELAVDAEVNVARMQHIAEAFVSEQ